MVNVHEKESIIEYLASGKFLLKSLLIQIFNPSKILPQLKYGYGLIL
jgi:hypothetical protein